MKISLFITLLFNTFIMMSQQSVHEFTINTIDGESKNLSDFKGKKMLFVNTASQCGFTPQYMELQELHEKHGDELVIIGFPANNFGGQEPGSNDQIKTFCKKHYGVSFMLSEKVSVKGKNIDPIFEWLNAQDNQSFKGDIMWNFEKYLIDESGKLLKRYRSMIKPDSDKIISLI